MVFKRGYPQGTYSFSSLTLSDGFGRNRTYNSAQSGWSTSIFVNSSVVDITPPTLDFFNVSDRTAATRSGNQAIVFNVSAGDDNFGVTSVMVTLTSPNRETVRSLSMARISGNGTSGWYLGSMTFTYTDTPGTWMIEIDITDAADNARLYTRNTLSSLSYPSVIQVDSIGPLPAIPSDDHVKPACPLVSIGPAEVNVVNTSATIWVFAQCHDDSSGVNLIEIGISGSDGVERTCTLGGDDLIPGASDSFLNGFFNGTMTLIPGVPNGRHKVSSIRVYDFAGNVGGSGAFLLRPSLSIILLFLLPKIFAGVV